jgi:hypothetical protein
MRFYARVIPEALFRELRRAGRVFSEEGFVLGGGTAVALRFGHRRSEDPEFFREEPMPYPEVVAERLRRDDPIRLLSLGILPDAERRQVQARVMPRSHFAIASV